MRDNIFFESTKYNKPDRVQLSEFDIWNYQAKKEIEQPLQSLVLL